MENYALFVSLQAKPGKEREVEDFLRSGEQLARQEAGTVRWYAFKTGPASFGIFDTFADESAREAHLNGEIAKALMAKAAELLAEPPKIHQIPILADKH